MESPLNWRGNGRQLREPINGFVWVDDNGHRKSFEPSDQEDNNNVMAKKELQHLYIEANYTGRAPVYV
jgi:hypothetical protein